MVARPASQPARHDLQRTTTTTIIATIIATCDHDTATDDYQLLTLWTSNNHHKLDYQLLTLWTDDYQVLTLWTSNSHHKFDYQPLTLWSSSSHKPNYKPSSVLAASS